MIFLWEDRNLKPKCFLGIGRIRLFFLCFSTVILKEMARKDEIESRGLIKHRTTR